MQSSRTPFALAAVLGILTMFLVAPAAEACCRPCGAWCSTVSPKTYCCTGIPEPGNFCGLTTCGEYLDGPSLELAVVPEWMRVPVSSGCDVQAMIAEAVEPVEPVEPAQPAQPDDAEPAPAR